MLTYPQVNVASLRGYFLYPVQNEIHCQNFLHSHKHTGTGDSQVGARRLGPGSPDPGFQGRAPPCAAVRVPAYVPSKCVMTD